MSLVCADLDLVNGSQSHVITMTKLINQKVPSHNPFGGFPLVILVQVAVNVADGNGITI